MIKVVELTPLRSFLAVAREGNVTRAAAQLDLTQPAVSGHVARLERELGEPLFDRTPRGLVLTAAGRLFLEHARTALTSLEAGREAVRSLAGLEAGSLRLGGGATATTYLLPPLLGRFHAEHPAVRLFLREQGSREVAGAVVAGELDLGIVTLPLDPPHPRLEEVPWVADELRLIVPPGHLLEGRARRRRSFRWRELEDVPLVLFEAGSAVRRLIDRRLEEAGVEPQIVMELRSIESIKQVVQQGIGAGFVSRFALEKGRGLRCAEGPLARSLAVVHRRDRTLSPAGRRFLALLRAA